MTFTPRGKDRTNIPGTAKTMQTIGEPLLSSVADLQLPVRKSHPQKNCIHFTALNWNASDSDPNNLQNVIDKFSRTGGVWSHTVLDRVITCY